MRRNHFTQPRKISLRFLDELQRTGAPGIQHDDAALNGEAVQWSGGNLTASGCYCAHCMGGFTASLLNSSTAAALRAEYNISAGWSYRDWLLARPIVDARSAPDRSWGNSTISRIWDETVSELQKNNGTPDQKGVRDSHCRSQNCVNPIWHTCAASKRAESD